MASRALTTGGSFVAGIGAILGAAGAWGLGDQIILYALVTLCVLAALTMFTAALVARCN